MPIACESSHNSLEMAHRRSSVVRCGSMSNCTAEVERLLEALTVLDTTGCNADSSFRVQLSTASETAVVAAVVIGDSEKKRSAVEVRAGGAGNRIAGRIAERIALEVPHVGCTAPLVKKLGSNARRNSTGRA